MFLYLHAIFTYKMFQLNYNFITDRKTSTLRITQFLNIIELKIFS